MIVGFREDITGASQGDLHVRCLKSAVCEVGSKFKAPRDIVRVFLSNTSSFKLDGNSKKIFTSSGNRVSPLGIEAVRMVRVIAQSK